MASFSEILAKKTIFRDKNALSPHVVPETLVHREREIEHVMEVLAPALEGRKPSNAFIYGKSGSGKTATTKHVLQKLDEENQPRAKSVYMNCRVYDSRYKVLQKCISEFLPEIPRTGHSFSLLYEKLLDWVEGAEDGVKGKQLILALDEVDMVKDLDNLLYTLTRANDDLKNGGVSVIGISNQVNFKNRLDVRARSALCEKEFVFQPYNAEQLRDILLQRAKLAFLPGAVEASAFSLAAAIAAGENGDARYALSLLLRAGELAETRKLQTVTDKEVEEARKAADEDKAAELVSTLPEHPQLVLYALALISQDTHYKRLVEENGEKFYFSGEVYERYRSLCRKTSKEPRTARWYREYVHDLESLGLLHTIESGKGIRGHATLIQPAYEAEKVKHIVEKNILGE